MKTVNHVPCTLVMMILRILFKIDFVNKLHFDDTQQLFTTTMMICYDIFYKQPRFSLDAWVIYIAISDYTVYSIYQISPV